MRLRLVIERNSLPVTRAIWPVKDNKQTIAQLLQHVNEVFPLEADTWGLEDYAASVGGYECLHWHEIAVVCKDEDELRIKPLQYVDVRARAMAGRDQVARDGRHLVDGVPFGRPCLKAPVRPDVSIPPRKKRKLGDGDAEQKSEPLMLMENGEEMDDEDDGEEDDEDFQQDASESESETSSGNESESSGASDQISESEDSSDSDSPDSDAESWDGFPVTPQKKDPAIISSGSGPTQSTQNSTQKLKRKRRSDSESADPVSEAISPGGASLPFQGNRETKRRNVRRRDVNKLKHLKRTNVLPADATLKTLQDWKNGDYAQTVKPVEKDSCDVRAMQDTAADRLEVDNADSGSSSDSSSSATSTSAEVVVAKVRDKQPVAPKAMSSMEHTKSEQFESRRKNLLAQLASGGIDASEACREMYGSDEEAKNAASAKNVKRRDRRVIKSKDSQQVEGPNPDDEPPVELSSKQQSVELPSVDAVEPIFKASTDMVPPSVARRSKLDLAGSKRLLFGSLGVRVPKTQDDKDQLQKKLADRAERAKKNAFGITSPLNGENAKGGAINAEDISEQQQVNGVGKNDDYDSWFHKINLTAVECCDEGVTLSVPPFPFVQRWDSQYRKRQKAAKRISGTYAQKKRKTNRGDYVETYDKYNTDGYGGDSLDYDDVDDDDEFDNEYWEEGALLDGGDYEVKTDAEFPPLPSSLDHLPPLEEHKAQKDDFITFQELLCDEGTNWEPQMVNRVAKVLELPTDSLNGEDESHKNLVLKLEKRECSAKVFDNEGNRVYAKFEMPDLEDDEEEQEETDEIRNAEWASLGAVRLLSRAEEVGNVDAA